MMKRVIFSAIATLVTANKDYDAMLNWYQGIDMNNVLYAVSCGSEESHTDVSGVVYSADKGYNGGMMSSDGYAKKKWIVPNAEVY